MTPSRQVRLNDSHLRDDSVVQEHKREVAESLGERNDSDDSEVLWTDLKAQILKVSERRLRGTRGMARSFLIKERLNSEGSRMVDSKERPGCTGS